MRITVSLVINLIANGMTIDEIIQAYPYLEAEDVRQALHYVAWLADESIYPAKAVEDAISALLDRGAIMTIRDGQIRARSLPLTAAE